MKKVLVIHGPNLNLLGTREPEIYGKMTLEDINYQLFKTGKELGVEISAVQTNLEGEIINHFHQAMATQDGVIINPAGYTHTSVAIRDAIAAIDLPVIEIHLSNVYAREEFRHKSLLAPVCVGKITGFGWRSYLLALQAMVDILTEGH